MLNELLSKLSGREAAEKKALEDRYVELLLSRDHDDAVVTELQGIMAKIGKTAADAAADAATLTRVQQLQRTIANGSGLDEQIQKAAGERDGFYKETQQIAKARDDRQEELSRACHILTKRKGEARASHEELSQLAARNPALVRTMEIPAWAD